MEYSTPTIFAAGNAERSDRTIPTPGWGLAPQYKPLTKIFICWEKPATPFVPFERYARRLVAQPYIYYKNKVPGSERVAQLIPDEGSNCSTMDRAGDSAGTPHYPSYVDLDTFIDVDQLKALDQFIVDSVRHRINRSEDLKFYTGPFLLHDAEPCVPGPQLIYLSRSSVPDDYYNLDEPELWTKTEAASEFSPLMDFIATLPFAATGRMLIIYDQSGRAVPAHRDHDSTDLCHEFIWFRTNLAKPFFMLDPLTGERAYVRSHSAWFDTVNQFHGADATGDLSISIRVDGRFTDAFREQIPFPPGRRAAAPASWAQSRAEQQ